MNNESVMNLAMSYDPADVPIERIVDQWMQRNLSQQPLNWPSVLGPGTPVNKEQLAALNHQQLAALQAFMPQKQNPVFAVGGGAGIPARASAVNFAPIAFPQVASPRNWSQILYGK